MVAVPAIWLGEIRDPFAPFDAAAYATTIVLIVMLGTRLRSFAMGVVCGALVTFATPLLDLTVVPWSSTVTLLAVLAGLALAGHSPRLATRIAAIVGALIGWTFAARYVDAAFLALMASGSIVRRARAMFVCIAVAGVLIATVLFTHAAILGSPLTTPYAAHVESGGAGISDQDLRAYSLSAVPDRLFGIVTGVQGGKRQPGEPLGARSFWFILAPLGLWALFRDRHPLRSHFALALAASIASTLFYLSFRASGAGMLQFGGLHYFKAWFPVWALLSIYGIARLLDRMRAKPGAPSPA
jgi:hypothetical protein